MAVASFITQCGKNEILITINRNIALECLRAVIQNRITAKALPSTAQHCPLFHVHLTSIVLAKVVIGLPLAVGPKSFVATDCLSIYKTMLY